MPSPVAGLPLPWCIFPPYTKSSLPMAPKRSYLKFKSGLDLPGHETRTQRKYRLSKEQESHAALRRLRAITDPAQPPTPHPQGLDDERVWEDIHEDEHDEAPPQDSAFPTYWGELGNMASAEDIETLRQIHSFNERRVQRQRHNNWATALQDLFGVYLHLKNKTDNWTAENSFHNHSRIFCTCESDKTKTTRWIDAVDILGQKRLAIHSCPCTPDTVLILANGYLASTPVIPQTCFSLRLLNFHHLLWNLCNVSTSPFSEALVRWNNTLSPPLLTKTSQKQRDLRRPLSGSIDSYRRLLTLQEEFIDRLNNSTPQAILARRSCPACFGPMPPPNDSEPSTDNKKIVLCLDGNFQHRHHAKASKNHIPLHIPSTFLSKSELEESEEKILEAEKSNSKTDNARDKCSDMHKAADDKRNASTWKGCDDTGLLGCCCRHDAAVYMCNIHKSGERRSLPMAILERVLKDLDQQDEVGVLYDIGCSLDKFISIRQLLPTMSHRLRFGTSVFHSYVHDWSCQLKYNPRYNQGWGLSDGEGLERLWSYLSPLVSPLRYATRNHRLSALHHRLVFHNTRGIERLLDTIDRKLSAALARRNAARLSLAGLVKMTNPYVSEAANFTPSYFRDQWNAQRDFEKTRTTESQDRQLKLAEIYEREEKLDHLRHVLVQTDLSHSCDFALKILEDIAELQAVQATQMHEIGSTTDQFNPANRQQERQLVLLWSAKSALFKIAVDLHGERQPLLHSKDRGDRLGTRLKEKIFEALKRHKPAVVKALNLFCARRKAYLTKFLPEQVESQGKEISYKEFMEMDLTHKFWNDGYCFLSKEPWAIDSSVRAGIQAILLMDRTGEEVVQLSSELRRCMSWGVAHHGRLMDSLRACHEDPNPQHILKDVDFHWCNFQQLQALIAAELDTCLHMHEKLLESWAEKVSWLWKKTTTSTETPHQWFTLIHGIQSFRDVHNQEAVLDQALEEMILDQEDADGEVVHDDLIADLTENLEDNVEKDRLLDDWEEQ